MYAESLHSPASIEDRLAGLERQNRRLRLWLIATTAGVAIAAVVGFVMVRDVKASALRDVEFLSLLLGRNPAVGAEEWIDELRETYESAAAEHSARVDARMREFDFLESVGAGADQDAARAQIGLLETPLGVYQLHMETFPDAALGLDALRVRSSDARIGQRWKGPYMDEPVPHDPWDQPYQYQFPGKHNPHKYDLWSLGPDGQDGTEDDIGNWSVGTQ